jgi:hypothetical protein
MSECDNAIIKEATRKKYKVGSLEKGIEEFLTVKSTQNQIFGNARKGKRNSKKATINACLIT